MQELTSCFRSSLFVLGCVQETRGQEKENTETGLSAVTMDSYLPAWPEWPEWLNFERTNGSEAISSQWNITCAELLTNVVPEVRCVRYPLIAPRAATITQKI